MENYNIRTFLIQNIQLNTLTSFNHLFLYNNLALLQIILFIFFQGILYYKKNILIFFLIIELLTGNRGGVLIAKKPSLRKGLNQGSIVGCKVTLRKSKLYSFLETLYISLPRLHNFKGIYFLKDNNKEFSFNINDLYIFHSIEFHINIIFESIKFNMLYNSNIIFLKKYIFKLFGIFIN